MKKLLLVFNVGCLFLYTSCGQTEIDKTSNNSDQIEVIDTLSLKNNNSNSILGEWQLQKYDSLDLFSLYLDSEENQQDNFYMPILYFESIDSIQINLFCNSSGKIKYTLDTNLKKIQFTEIQTTEKSCGIINNININNLEDILFKDLKNVTTYFIKEDTLVLMNKERGLNLKFVKISLEPGC